MDSKSKRKLNFLISYAIVSSLVFSFFIFSSFVKNNGHEKFEEITVKRINLVAEDGSLRMVLSNETRQHPGSIKGRDMEKRERPAGVLFFNTEGSECGGITYYAQTNEGVTQSGMSFTMDQYNEDQVIQILNGETYKDGEARITRGISINDLPLGSDIFTRMDKINEVMNMKDEAARTKRMQELGNSLSSKQRVFIGRTIQNNSGLFLAGPDGKKKIKIYVDENGNPKFEVVDGEGNTKNILENK